MKKRIPLAMKYKMFFSTINDLYFTFRFTVNKTNKYTKE